MKELGILYTPENIRAVARKDKWQTRRVITEVPFYCHLKWNEGPRKGQDRWIMDWGLSCVYEEDGRFWLDIQTDVDDNTHGEIKPRYRVGDVLYVKEAYYHGIEWDDCSPGEVDPLCGGNDLWYAVNGPPPTDGWGKLRSPMFMPKWAARPELKRRVTEVRVQRVQDISEEDAIAEGIEVSVAHGEPAYYLYDGRAHYTPNPIDSFQTLWDSINAKPKPVREKKVITHYVSYPWDNIHETRELRGKPWYVCGNPYVFAYTFEEL